MVGVEEVLFLLQIAPSPWMLTVKREGESLKSNQQMVIMRGGGQR